MGKLLLLVILIAIAIYLLVRVIERRGLASPEDESRRPFGPDDDPDFLRDLDRRPDDDR